MRRAAREGDESAFAEIVRRYSPRVFRTASRFFRRREQVEEAAQEIFLKAFTQLSSYGERGSFEGWLTRVARNTCLNILRGAKRRPETTLADLTEDEGAWLEAHAMDFDGGREATVEDRLVAADLADRLLEKLPPEDRAVLLMIDGEGVPVKEAAEAAGWSESKVKVRAFRARRKLREALEKLLGDAPGATARREV